MLVYQNVDKNDIHVFTRNLSEKVNINLKHMIQDFENQEKQETQNKKKSKNKKPKKKDIIIAEQNKKRKIKYLEEDDIKINYFLKNNKKSNTECIYEFVKQLKTKEKQLDFKFKILELFWNKKSKNIENIMGLYFQLNDKCITEQHKQLIQSIKHKIEQYEYNLYMLKNLGHILPPLNFWDQTFKFDDWQIKALNVVKKNQSLIVKAPTSSGKSFIACSAPVFHKKVLYICPTEPVAYQIGSQFIKMNYRVHFLLDNIGHFSYDEKCNVFVGTPEYVEDYLYKIDSNFDYAVFDEIHDIDYSYENLIKLIRCNFLALSATINNLSDFICLFKKIHPEKSINTIEYGKRFINTQKWTYQNNQLTKIHPLTCYENINDIENVDLKMTPEDIANLWENFEEIFDEFAENTNEINDIDSFIEQCSPDNYFENNDKLLTLDSVKEYETFLKNKIVYLNKIYPQQIKKVIHNLNVKQLSCDKNNIIHFLNTCKKNKMFPMLIFNACDSACEEIFYDVYEKLVKSENENYPYHYDILEKKQELYLNYYEKRKIFSDNLKPPKRGDARDYIDKKLNVFDEENKTIYFKTMMNYYNTLIEKIKNNDISEKIKKIQTENLNKDLNDFIKCPDFCYQDVYKKHSKYSYNICEPMSGKQIKEVRKKILDSLGVNIQYEHPIFQMLKRGIGLYIENSPEEYRRILQTLLINKEIGIVISGKMLSTGIDMPIKTSCLMNRKNTNFNNSDYLQMSGRAGRRGHDTSGNIIFYDIDYKKLIQSGLPTVSGTNKPMYTHYKYIEKLKNIKTDVVFENFLNDSRKIINTEINEYNRNNMIIFWHLRKYKNYLKCFEKINDKKYDEIVDEYDKCEYLLNCLQCLFSIDFVDDYKKNKYNQVFKNLINVIIVFYNFINNTNKKENLKKIYDTLKRIIFKNNGFFT